MQLNGKSDYIEGDLEPVETKISYWDNEGDLHEPIDILDIKRIERTSTPGTNPIRYRLIFRKREKLRENGQEITSWKILEDRQLEGCILLAAPPKVYEFLFGGKCSPDETLDNLEEPLGLFKDYLGPFALDKSDQ